MATNNPDELAVKYGGLDAITTVLGNQAKKLDDDLRALKTAMERVAAGWEGEAHRAFTRQQKQWDADATAIHTALKEISRRVTDAGGDYRGGDLRAAGYFQ
ncbi:WXG100 family type VII secretion target [Streptomyces sp. O3]